MQGNSREADLGYAAGIIDGEGSIFITHDYYQHKNPVHRLEIRIGMINRKALDKIIRTVGVGKVVQEPSYQNKRPMFRLVYQNRNSVKQVLDQIYPHLAVKQPQADLAYKFLKIGTGLPGSKLTEEQKIIRRELYEEMRLLNGVAAPATTERRGRPGRDMGIRLQATV